MLAHWLRRELRTRTILKTLTRLEQSMATQAETITELGNRFETLGNVVADIAADFAAFRQAMEAERERLSDAGQAALDEANMKADATAAKLTNLDVEVGDADGSDTPPVEPQPEPEQPQF